MANHDTVGAKSKTGDLHLETIDADGKVVDGTPIIENRAEKEKVLLRKIDLRMMPLMMVIYILNYLDRNNIATARLGSFEKDIGLVGNNYNTVISIFFVGYILTQIPTNLILSKVRPSLFLPSVMIGWATISASGALFLFSSWYTKKELAARISILYAAGQMAGAFGGLLGAAIMGGMDGKAGLANWRWLFIIEGGATVPVAIVTMFVLPDYPATTTWLSGAERQLAVLRMAEEANEEDDRAEVPARAGRGMAFRDPALYYLVWLMQLGLNPAAAFTNFFPTMVETLGYGYGETRTLLPSAPPYVFAALLGIANSAHRDRARERWRHVVWPQVLLCGARASRAPSPTYAAVNAGSNLAAVYAAYLLLITPPPRAPRYWQANVANVASAGRLRRPRHRAALRCAATSAGATAASTARPPRMPPMAMPSAPACGRFAIAGSAIRTQRHAALPCMYIPPGATVIPPDSDGVPGARASPLGLVIRAVTSSPPPPPPTPALQKRNAADHLNTTIGIVVGVLVAVFVVATLAFLYVYGNSIRFKGRRHRRRRHHRRKSGSSKTSKSSRSSGGSGGGGGGGGDASGDAGDGDGAEGKEGGEGGDPPAE
ncbi:major facilitator superfamily domain-containing protein [Xylariomycetidae sp. FL0641]|nr:major facilitator superfamily domain-containing protein [Xylariomycetidae sp. FL0641]